MSPENDDSNDGPEGFWDHVFNALGHVSDAQAMTRPTRAERKARRIRTDAEPEAGPAIVAPKRFGGGADGGDCCVAKRKIKRG